MDPNINPYASPYAFDLLPSREPRSLAPIVVSAIGAVTGALVYLLSLSLTPTDVAKDSLFDLELSRRVGLLFPMAIGAWIAWMRRSLLWGCLGPTIGGALGSCYWATTSESVPFSIYLLPALIGAAASATLGLSKSDISSLVLGRILRGACAGLALGLVYMSALGLFGLFDSPGFGYSVDYYISSKWRIGTPAFSIAASVFYPLFHWASRVRYAAA